MIQIDAPLTVASFLQRLGRTGRRADTVANALLLTTRRDAFLQALGLLLAWEDGYVEPLDPPPLPLHLVVQQLLAVVLQEGGVGRHLWHEWLGDPFVLGEDVADAIPELTDSLLDRDYLFEDNGLLGIGAEGQRRFGGRHFLDLMAVFTDPPTLTVLAGRREIGRVPARLLMLEDRRSRNLLLAGRDWRVRHVDWRQGVVHAEPAMERGSVQWFSEPRALSFALCQAIKRVLSGEDLLRTTVSRRAAALLRQLREEFWWLSDEPLTFLTRDAPNRRLLWTFAGMHINTWLITALDDLSDQAVAGDLHIRLAAQASPVEVRERLKGVRCEDLHLADRAADGAIERLKFGDALPEAHARLMVERRFRDDAAVQMVAKWPVRLVGQSATAEGAGA